VGSHVSWTAAAKGGAIRPERNRGSCLASAGDADRGQAAFTRTGLALYDLLVLRALCPWVWRCPNDRVLAAYRRYLSDNHLEVGVGTGYFLDHARFSSAAPRVALLDLNTHCLTRTARRIARYRPEVYQADVLQPIILETRRFDSIALNYVVHCLPALWPQSCVALFSGRA
jgi:hypothetical protein